jgi:hypothetical protein
MIITKVYYIQVIEKVITDMRNLIIVKVKATVKAKVKLKAIKKAKYKSLIMESAKFIVFN